MSELQHDNDQPFPSIEFFAGHYLPDLPRIPRAQWRAALAPLGPMARERCLRQQPLEIYMPVFELICQLDAEDVRRRRAMRRAALATDAVPTPSAGAGHRRVRQVNARLFERDFLRLQQAAGLLGVRPSELARTFIVRGTARVLEEHERSRRQP